jgi:hypothetical protein
MQDFPYIDAKAAAELCGWSYQKFQRIAAKEIPHQRFSDLGNRLYKTEDVLLYKKERVA